MKFLVVFSIFILCFVSVGAQERKYEITVFLEETGFSKTSAQIPVRVTITNRSERVLKTSGLKNIHFYFSKCILGAPCEKNDDIYVAFIKIPSKRIRENRSFEFAVNLANLFWKDVKINPMYTKSVKNFQIIPSENIYFYAGIKSLEGFKMKNFGPRYDKNGKLTRVAVKRTPIYKIVNSNIIGVVFK